MSRWGSKQLRSWVADVGLTVGSFLAISGVAFLLDHIEFAVGMLILAGAFLVVQSLAAVFRDE